MYTKTLIYNRYWPARNAVHYTAVVVIRDRLSIFLGYMAVITEKNRHLKISNGIYNLATLATLYIHIYITK